MKRLLPGIISLVLVQPGGAQATFHGNNAHTGVYSTPGPLQVPAVKWQFKTGGAVISSPAIADGVVYVGSADGFVYALR